MSAIAVEAVDYAVGHVPILLGVSLAVPAGSRYAIVGESGSGKSTLLRLIAGFLTPDAGSIALDGVIVAGPARSVPAHLRRVAYVPQDGALFPHLSVRANIAFGLRGRRVKTGVVEAIAERVGLDPDLLDRRPDALSGGQQQRVALARAIVVDPPALVMDEPFSALDVGLRAATRSGVLSALSAAGTTAVLVTHDQEEALTFGEGIGVLQHGVLTQSGPPGTVFDFPRTPAVAALLGAAIFLPGSASDGTASTPLGRVPLRGGTGAGGAVEVLIRPTQLQLAAGGTAGVVRAVGRGGEEMHLRIEVGGILLPMRVPVHVALPREGDEVEVVVHGTGLAYPAR